MCSKYLKQWRTAAHRHKERSIFRKLIRISQTHLDDESQSAVYIRTDGACWSGGHAGPISG